MRLFLITLLLLLFSCDKKQIAHPVFDYYPNSKVFEDGYVSKYYFHFYPDDSGKNSLTEIRYIKYKKLTGDQFRTETYNAGFELVNNREYRVIKDTIFVENGTNIFRNDTTSIDLLSNVSSIWSEGKMDKSYQVRYESNDNTYIYTEYQESSLDALIDGRKAKVFYNDWHTHLEGKADSLFYKGSTKSYFVADLGFFGSDSDGSTYKRKVELMEQMSVSEFEKRANHGKHRIGYINPERTLSDDSGFSICGDEYFIMDYYNLDPSAGYLKGKGEMRKLILEQVVQNKLKGQSGMLTFRFVINCKGEAGRFVANAVDFNFQEIEFSQESVSHLLNILQGLDAWQDLGNLGEKDAYTYITFKIEDGEINEILP